MLPAPLPRSIYTCGTCRRSACLPHQFHCAWHPSLPCSASPKTALQRRERPVHSIPHDFIEPIEFLVSGPWLAAKRNCQPQGGGSPELPITHHIWQKDSNWAFGFRSGFVSPQLRSPEEVLVVSCMVGV